LRGPSRGVQPGPVGGFANHDVRGEPGHGHARNGELSADRHVAGDQNASLGCFQAHGGFHEHAARAYFVSTAKEVQFHRNGVYAQQRTFQDPFTRLRDLSGGEQELIRFNRST
ncbi:MAG: hypothetical protein ACYTEQ_26980, partial [Planctomycetota bacterium]